MQPGSASRKNRAGKTPAGGVKEFIFNDATAATGKGIGTLALVEKAWSVGVMSDV